MVSYRARDYIGRADWQYLSSLSGTTFTQSVIKLVRNLLHYPAIGSRIWLAMYFLSYAGVSPNLRRKM